tara:strand:- start:81 stop:344 length:264 start_codon:yes stop_codon:yes gene_type:complete
VEQVEMVKHLLFQVHLLQELVAEQVVGIRVIVVLRGHQQVVQVVEELVEDMRVVEMEVLHQLQVAQTLGVAVVLMQKVVLVVLVVQA